MPPVPLVALIVLALAVGAVVIHRFRVGRLSRVRASWGKRLDRVRRMDAMAASHVSRTSRTNSRSLDDRTWADLNLGDVFAAIDRTGSTLGQPALYHRLRTAPSADHPAHSKRS